jgi:hypothetical protein
MRRRDVAYNGCMSRRWICRLLMAAGTVAFFGGAGWLAAAEPEVVSAETRTYDIFVDGKNSGQSTLTITRYSDGSESVSADAKVTVSWTVFSYVYEFHGKELWRDGRFEQLESRAVDGGKQLALSVKRADGGFQVVTKAKGRPATVSDVQLTTNYWREPTVGTDARAIAVLDADTGKLYDEKIERLGQQELTIGGQRIATNAYRLKGKLDVELWFDAQGFLVRQVGKEDGHPTEVRLAKVQEARAASKGKER